jgi:hypothetical protein
MLTKEQMTQKLELIKLNQMMEVQTQTMLQEIDDMYREIGLKTVNGVFTINLNALENKFSLQFKLLANNMHVPILDVPGFDVYWDKASWEIFKRDVKDVFYEIRKQLNEKEKSKPLSFWKKLLKTIGL